MSDRYEDYGWRDAEQTAAHAYLLPPIIREVQRWHGCRRILDAGCGNGVVARALEPLVDDVYAFDMSESGLRHAKRALGEGHAAKASVYDDWREIFGGVDSFDGVVSSEVIEHIYDPRQLVYRAFEALVPGGHLVLTTPYHGYLKNLALAATGKLDEHFTALWHGGHIKFWSRKTLTHLLEDVGFRVLRFEGAGRLPYLWKSMLLSAERPASRKP